MVIFCDPILYLNRQFTTTFSQLCQLFQLQIGNVNYASLTDNEVIKI